MDNILDGLSVSLTKQPNRVSYGSNSIYYRICGRYYTTPQKKGSADSRSVLGIFSHFCRHFFPRLLHYHSVFNENLMKWWKMLYLFLKAEEIFAVNYGEWEITPTVAGLVVYSDTILSVYFVRGTLVVIIMTYILLTYSVENLYKDLNDFAIAQNKAVERTLT